MPTMKVKAGKRLATADMNVADVNAIPSTYRLSPNVPLHVSYVFMSNQFITDFFYK